MKVIEQSTDNGGLRTTVGFQDDKLVIKYDQDVQAALEHTNKLRNAPEYAKNGIAKSWMHAAHIPDVVMLKMKLEDGFDCIRAHPREIAEFLMKHRDKYGYLFTTTGRI